MTSWWDGRRVTVTGGHGFVGRRVVALLRQKQNVEVMTFSSQEYDLTRQTEVARMYEDQRPDTVIHLAARVGGIGANRGARARLGACDSASWRRAGGYASRRRHYGTPSA